MKKLSFVLLICSVFGVFAQEKTHTENTPTDALLRKNEVRLNATSLLFYGVDVSYERILNEDIGVGVSSLFARYEKNGGLNYHFSPYARYYFGKKPAAGFFFEGFFSVFGKDYSEYSLVGNYYQYNSKKHTGIAFGFGVGAKLINRAGFNLEFHFGVGREPRSWNNDNTPFMAKGGISIGYRF